MKKDMLIENIYEERIGAWIRGGAMINIERAAFPPSKKQKNVFLYAHRVHVHQYATHKPSKHVQTFV